MMAELTEYTLKKCEKIIVLQEMMHIAPESIYKWIQLRLDQLSGNGFLVFYEGSADDTLQSRLSFGERRIANFFRFMVKMEPMLCDAWDYKAQRDMIKYPDKSVNADISFSKTIKLLSQSGFKPPVGSIRLYITEKLIKSMDKNMVRELFQSYLFKFNLSIRMNSYSMGIDSILIDYRNNEAIKRVLSHINENGQDKALIHYGKAHAPGMLEILRNNGWEIVYEKVMLIPDEYVLEAHEEVYEAE
jgi:hypothetical protein